MAHPPELKKRAKDLRKQGLPLRVIVGVPKPTVIRWLNPELEKRERTRARKLKWTTRKKCVICKTRRVSKDATMCRRCYLTVGQRKWTAERLVEAIQDWAIKHGHPPAYQDWQRSGPGHPAISSIFDGENPPFKRWSELLLAAGFTPKRRRKRAPLTEAMKRERAAMRRQFRELKLKNALEKGEQE